MKITIQEDFNLFLAANPRKVPRPPAEELAVENLRRLIERLQAIIALYQKVERAYYKLMDWKYPWVTGLSMVIFTYMCLFASAEKAGSMAIFVVLAIMSYAGWGRRTGQSRRAFVEREEEGQHERKVGILRVGILGVRLSEEDQEGGKLFVVVTYAGNWDVLEGHADLIVGCFSSGIATGPERQQPSRLDVEYKLPLLVAAHFPNADRGSLLRNVLEEVGDNGGGTATDHRFLVYPLVQPLIEKSGKMESVPLKETNGWVRVRVYRSTFEENFMGEAMIPLRQVVLEGEGVEGWVEMTMDPMLAKVDRLGDRFSPQKGAGVSVKLKLAVAPKEAGGAEGKEARKVLASFIEEGVAGGG